jgi:pimeloyl-ACP methyl ester carboxylesterase
MTAREITLDTPTLRLAARRWHEGAPVRVLALHGWLDNAASFDSLAPLLGDCDVVALDLPGHGRSQHRAPGNWYHYVDYLSDVAFAADALGWDRCVLLGHSLGGAVASVFAAALPQRVRQLWTIEALGPISTAPSRALELLRAAMQERAVMNGKSLRVFPTLDDAIAARRTASRFGEVAARMLVTRGTREVDGGVVWSSDPRLTMTSAIRLTDEQIDAYLAGISCPTLVIAADPAPTWIPHEAMARRIALLKDGTRAIVPGSHHVHLEDAPAVAAALAQWRATHPLDQ